MHGQPHIRFPVCIHSHMQMQVIKKVNVM